MSDYRDEVVLSVLCPSCGEVDLTPDQLWLGGHRYLAQGGGQR